MKKSNPFARDYSDSMEIALLLCRAANISHSDERAFAVATLEMYIRKRSAISGDFYNLKLLAKSLCESFAAMPMESIEAALHLYARAGSKRPPKLAPAHLRGLTEAQIATYVVTLQLPRQAPRRSARTERLKKLSRSR